VCPDNLKSGVTKACRYEPDINPTYQRWAAWYGTAVVPARHVNKEADNQPPDRRYGHPQRPRDLMDYSKEIGASVRKILKELDEFKEADGA
ncbi:MAG: IS21 family transposase, partial [Deltaproteobacteria bacterium HGW-Deltaproteobacteria-21]